MLQFMIRNSLVAIQLPLARDGHGCPKLNAQSFARMRNRQSVHKGAWMPEVERPKFCRTQNKQSVHKPRMWCWARDSAVLKKVGGVTIPQSCDR